MRGPAAAASLSSQVRPHLGPLHVTLLDKKIAVHGKITSTPFLRPADADGFPVDGLERLELDVG